MAGNAPTLNKYIMMAFGMPTSNHCDTIMLSARVDAIYLTVNQLLCYMMFETTCATNVIGISDSKCASCE